MPEKIPWISFHSTFASFSALAIASVPSSIKVLSLNLPQGCNPTPTMNTSLICLLQKIVGELVEHAKSPSHDILSLVVLVQGIGDRFHVLADFERIQIAFHDQAGHLDPFREFHQPDPVRSDVAHGLERRRTHVMLDRVAGEFPPVVQQHFLHAFARAPRSVLSVILGEEVSSAGAASGAPDSDAIPDEIE